MQQRRLISTRSRRRPLFVPFPVGLRLAVAVGVVLMMMVAFDVGYTLGSRQRPYAVTVVGKSEPIISSPAKPKIKTVPKTVNTQESKKTPAPELPNVVESKASQPKSQESKPTAKSVAADSFTTVVLPIFTAKCISCHGDPATKGGLDLRSVTAIKQGGNSGAALAPGGLSASTMWKSIDDGTMPPAGKAKLTTAEIATIRKWIEEQSR